MKSSLIVLFMLVALVGFFAMVALIVFLVVRKSDRVKILELKKPEANHD